MTTNRKITTIAAAFNELKPGLADDFARGVTSRLNQLLDKYPTAKELEALAHSWSYDGESYRNLRGMLKATERHPVTNFPLGYEVDPQRIEKEAAQYAEYTVAKFVYKLTNKLADLDDVDLVRVAGSTDFTIRGTLAGKEVQVDQQQILNWSAKGNPYHQFPALIYVEGKKVSEKQFKEMTGKPQVEPPKAEQHYFETPAQAYRAEKPYRDAGHRTMVRRNRNCGVVLYVYPKEGK